MYAIRDFMWIPSNCECECNESWDVGKYLDYENCMCRKRLVDKLVEEYTKKIEKAEITLFQHEKACKSSCTL